MVQGSCKTFGEIWRFRVQTKVVHFVGKKILFWITSKLENIDEPLPDLHLTAVPNWHIHVASYQHVSLGSFSTTRPGTTEISFEFYFGPNNFRNSIYLNDVDKYLFVYLSFSFGYELLIKFVTHIFYTR